MAISIKCPSCGSKLSAPDKAAGKSTKCPRCGGQIQVSLAQTAPSGQRPVIVARPVSMSPPIENKPDPLQENVSDLLQASSKRRVILRPKILLLVGAVVVAGLLLFVIVTFLTGSFQPSNNQLTLASRPHSRVETQPEKPHPEPGKAVGPAMPKPGIPVTVNELLEAFKNEVAAKEAYVGKVVDVTGIFVHQGDKSNSLTSNGDWHVYLSEKPVTYWTINTLQNGNPFSTVVCFPASGQKKDFAFSVGEKVTIRGTCVEGNSVRVHLKDCFLVKSHKEQQLARDREVRKEDMRRVASGPVTKTDPSRISGSKGDALEVSGIVTQVTRKDVRLDGWASPSGYEKEELCVVIEGGIGGITTVQLECYFRPEHKDAVTKLHAGQSIVIRGILDHKEGTNQDDGFPFLKYCTLIKDKVTTSNKKGK